MNQIYQVIKNGIMKKRNKTITLNELYSIAKGSNMISSVDLSDPEGIQVFQNAVNELIGDAIIESIGKSQNSFFELPGKFKILNEEDREVQRLKDGIVKLIIPPATTFGLSFDHLPYMYLTRWFIIGKQSGDCGKIW